MDYSYKEVDKALENRISAHAKYSNFNLHEWLANKFKIKQSENILDLGCGDGNYIDLFWNSIKPYGKLHAIDINKDLINIAKKKHESLSENITIEAIDYDELSFSNLKYNWIFSIYSIYYTQDPTSLVNNLAKHMLDNSKFVITGPSSRNALELDKINFAVTGKKRNIEDVSRMHRVEEEFTKLFSTVFGKNKTSLEFIDTKMSFPTVEEYATYYWSTLLWRESSAGISNEEIALLKDKTIDVIKKMPNFVLNKQMSCLVGTS
jgi:ubiquinone/menaquinone biosynthesis C-methylase UbiE